ncbi:unnamed protein product [Rhizoctonia solani]|uniref:Transmembrane protein n=1 Tax=Rhizoctonia solani TaxID=456999 RepID=A0A8H3HYM7_9AGAM|nr:unnamed protein product [Rhizoctonia solani]
MLASNLPPWDLLSFTFGWGSNITTTISQCDSVTLDYVGTVNGRMVNPPPTPPYAIVLYSGEFEPLTISVNNSAATGNTQWLVNLPVGPTFAVAMKDSRGYSGGVLNPAVKMVPGAGCDLTSPLKASSLNISVNDISTQCQDIYVAVNNGTPPYTLEVISLGGQTPKTTHFALSPLRFTLDLNTTTEYWCVKGSYKVGFSSDKSCLGAATTVTAGKFTTMYPGGTALPTLGNPGGPEAGSSAGLKSVNIAVFMAVLVPFLSVACALVLLWLCFRHSSPDYLLDALDRSKIGDSDGYASEYTPVPIEYTSQDMDPTSSRVCSSSFTVKSSHSKTPRLFVNPDSHYLGPVEQEPFDPRTLH